MQGIGEKQTIEFRQHESTSDVERICSYIDFISSMVKYCRRPESKQELDILLGWDSDLRRADATVVDLCRLFKCKRSTGEYYARTMDREYTKDLYKEQMDQAQNAILLGHPLALLAKASFDDTRRQLRLRNRYGRVMEKLLKGGYGLWPSNLVNDFVDYVDPTVPTARRQAVYLDREEERATAILPYNPQLYQLSSKYSTPSAGNSRTNSPKLVPSYLSFKE